MKEKYCKDLTILNARVSPLDSGTWKFICIFRNTAADNMTMDTSTGLWTWKANASGNFIFSLAWNLVRCHSLVFEFYTLVWFPAYNPKMACCLLRALKNRLLTRDRLSNFGITQQVQCVMCHIGLESIHHVFFACPYASYIWSLCKLKLTLNPTISSIEE